MTLNFAHLNFVVFTWSSHANQTDKTDRTAGQDCLCSWTRRPGIQLHVPLEKYLVRQTGDTGMGE